MKQIIESMANCNYSSRGQYLDKDHLLMDNQALFAENKSLREALNKATEANKRLAEMLSKYELLDSAVKQILQKRAFT